MNFKSHFACLSVVVFFLTLTPFSSAETNKMRTTVFVAEKVLTMDNKQSEATAVAVADGKILAVGSLESIRTQLGNGDLEINKEFAGKILFPGFIDNHLHPTLAGILLPSVFITPYDWHLPNREVTGVRSQKAYLSALQSALLKADPDELFITWGYHQYFHGNLSREVLDELAPEQAVLVWHRSFHEVILNSKALALLNLKAQDFAGNPAVDYAQGHFWELGLFAIFPKLSPIVLHPDRYQRGVLEGFQHAQKNGITTVADQGFPLFDLESELTQVNAVLSNNSLPIQLHIVGNGKTLALDGFEKGLQRLAALPTKNTERINFLPKQVKLLADGAFYSQLMQMEEGYLDGHEGEWITRPAELETGMRAYWQAGYRMHIHVNGDKGVRVVLDLIEKLNGETPRKHETVLHHYGYSNSQQAQRLAKLGISVSANPYYLWALADKYAEIGLGPKRANHISRLGDLERNNVAISLHSDLPMAPASPLALAGIAASRITAQGNLLAPDQRLSAQAALRAITLDAARAIGVESRVGSVSVGKQADFTILDSNPYDVSPENWHAIKVIGTIKNGLPYLN